MRDHWRSLLKDVSYSSRETILDVGGGMDPVPIADCVIDVRNFGLGGKRYVILDLNCDHFPFPDKSFDIAICSQTLEDLASPGLALKEMSRVAKRGVIEVPHRGAESIRDTPHHKWLIESHGNKLWFTIKRRDMLLKYPVNPDKQYDGIKFVWQDKINWHVMYDIFESDMHANYSRFSLKSDGANLPKYNPFGMNVD